MNEKVSTFFTGKNPYPFFGFLKIKGGKKWGYLILGTIGLLITGLFIYQTQALWPAGSKIQYSLSDVVYGEKIRAVHSMESGTYSQPSTLSPASLSTKPEMQLSESYYDFGVIDSQQVVNRTFVIANSGQSPLIIRRAYTTCGCTIADFTTTQIPPGKVGLMTLQFDPGYHDMQGTTVRRGVIIETNDPDHPTQEVWIQASIK